MIDHARHSAVPPNPEPGPAPASDAVLVPFAQLIALDGLDGQLLCHAASSSLRLGDVLYLRERQRPRHGLVVQVTSSGLALEPQADMKARMRLRALLHTPPAGRSSHPAGGTDDPFWLIRVKVRATVTDGHWTAPDGRPPTGPVDVVQLGGPLVIRRWVASDPRLALHIGDYQGAPVRIYGGALEKICLITGAKGGGKSHLAKGLIAEGRRLGMSAVVFEVNGEYDQVDPEALLLRPCVNLKVRLDAISTETLFRVVGAISPFPERTQYVARSILPQVIKHCQAEGQIPDLDFLIRTSDRVIAGGKDWEVSMRSSYERTLDTLAQYGLFATATEARAEESALRGGGAWPPVVSLRGAFSDVFAGRPRICVLQLGGLAPVIQQLMVALVLDHLEQECQRQTAYQAGEVRIPLYPTVVFEEAHLYIAAEDLTNRLTLCRHTGLHLVLATNSPSALPDAVYRLIDNIFLTRMSCETEIARIAECGLADTESVRAFVQNLADHHALLLSTRNGATRGYPLIIHIRDFGLPASGQTRSQWAAMRAWATAQGELPL